MKQLKSEIKKSFSEKVNMYNLYYNSLSSEESKKKYMLKLLKKCGDFNSEQKSSLKIFI